jgi:hypothetical protein
MAATLAPSLTDLREQYEVFLRNEVCERSVFVEAIA